MTTPSNAQSLPEETDIVIGPREQLFHLIAEASEIEHTLMCSYLYAAFSLKTGDTGLSPTEAKAVDGWRQSILSVAIEEMSHLLLAANLSIALGGRPYFGRPNFPVPPGYFPSGIVVKLTPFSRETLDHFIFVERPQGHQLADGEGFEHEQDYQREEAYEGLMPSVQDYRTIGWLYEALRANLIASARRIGERSLFIGPIAGQVGSEAIDMQGVSTITDLESALSAIDTIVEQGEGSPADRDDSHYHRFLSIKNEYDALLAGNPEFQPAWPCASNPVMRRPPEPEDKVFIDDPQAARVLDFANATYGLLLRLLVQAFGRFSERPSEGQARCLRAAVELMHILSSAASHLTRMPASPDHPGINAGMTFTMLRSVEPLFTGTAENQLIGERLSELARGARYVGSIVAPLADLEARLTKLAEIFERR
ncbi:MAG: ferritin-like protein [Steroidobacteraceae bacterium]